MFWMKYGHVTQFKMKVDTGTGISCQLCSVQFNICLADFGKLLVTYNVLYFLNTMDVNVYLQARMSHL
jgi:hypothetical protein